MPLSEDAVVEVEMRYCSDAVSKIRRGAAGHFNWDLGADPEAQDVIAYRYRLDSTETQEEKEELDRIEVRQAAKRSKYHREIKPGIWVDVYDVLHAWRVQNPALQHLIKKSLQPGERGHKTREQDMKDIVASALRAGELGE